MGMPDKEESKKLGTDHTANRLNEIERKLEGIEAKLKEKDKEQDAEKRNRDMLEANLSLVAKRLTELEKKGGNKNKDLHFNQVLDRLCLLEKENQSLQVENEKFEI
eukprot:Seg2028.8 transcript_id=Seg2028.8/GoldUCD/mRNA.D3Y31 product="hypothetical protein" protein_id=Seg2028.8/GoldUCD/D3Y31